MMMKTRYEPHEVQDGQKTLQAFLDDLKALDVLPKLQPPGMEPSSYMCAANMDALMAKNDDGDLVADIAFRNVPPGCPELLGIRRANLCYDLAVTREIGKSLILDVLYGVTAPDDVPLLCDTEAANPDCRDCATFSNVEEQVAGDPRNVFVNWDGNRYEVVRKYMQRPLSRSELKRLQNYEISVTRRMAEVTKPAIMTDQEIEAANMDALYCALADAGITGFIGYYDFYGEDFGRFRGIRAICRQKLVELPALEIQHVSKDATGRQGHTSKETVRLALCCAVRDILLDIQVGYDFGRGTYFEFRCDVATRKFHIKASGYDLEDEFLELDLVC